MFHVIQVGAEVEQTVELLEKLNNTKIELNQQCGAVSGGTSGWFFLPVFPEMHSRTNGPRKKRNVAVGTSCSCGKPGYVEIGGK